MTQVTESNLASLRWMKIVNRDGIGLFWPTIRKVGPIEECQHLVDEGLCILETASFERERCGYWITKKGLALLGEG